MVRNGGRGRAADMGAVDVEHVKNRLSVTPRPRRAKPKNAVRSPIVLPTNPVGTDLIDNTPLLAVNKFSYPLLIIHL